MTSFHGRILLEQRDPNPTADQAWREVTTQLASVEVRGSTPTDVLFAMADHLAALIKQSPDPAIRKQANDIMRIGLPKSPPALPDVANTAPPPGADQSPLPPSDGD